MFDHHRNLEWLAFEANRLPVPNESIHLWKINTSIEHEEYLLPHERERARGVRNDETRISYLSSQGGLRRLLSLYLQRPAGDIEVLREEHGKPYVRSGPHFNISHSAGRIFAAFSDSAVGLDVENLARSVSEEALADKFFAPAEREHIHSVAENEIHRLFLRYWVCKEASVKLSGDGIYHGLRDAEIILHDGGPSRGHYRGKEIWFWEFVPAEGMIGAVASWKPIEPNLFFQIGKGC